MTVLDSEASTRYDVNGSKWLENVFSDGREVLWPREAGEFVARKTKLLRLNKDKVDGVARMVYNEAKAGGLAKTEFHGHELHPEFNDPERTARWVFFIDTINFCFWYGHGRDVEYMNKTYTGYFAGAACLHRAIEVFGVDVTEPGFMRTMTGEMFEKLFYGKCPMGLSDLRARAIAEAGRVLIAKYQSSVLNLLKAANGSAQNLIKLLIRDFGSYRDSVVYRGKRLLILKRAQIFAADVHSALKSNAKTPFANFQDIDSLTMFADYRVPQVLCHLGVLDYSKTLQNLLRRFSTIRKGSRCEAAIRALSIHACDVLTKRIRALERELGPLPKPITDADLDVFLWFKRRENAAAVEKTVPHHRVVTWFY